MRTTKLGAVLASLAVTAGTATVLAAGPAHADTATEVTLKLGGYTSLTAVYGSYLGGFTGEVSDGTNAVYAGSAKLQRRLPGKSWRNVKTDATMPFLDFGNYGSKAWGNVKYRVHYLGGTDTSTATTYHESYSNVVTVRTAWNLHPKASCTTRCRFYGKLSPKARHHRIVIQVKHHGWKRYRVIRTNRRSHWTVFVKPGRGNGTYYRAVVAGTRHLIKTYALGHFTLIGRSAYRISQR
jgi:hypothetical protein